jgi:hypothetical protein
MSTTETEATMSLLGGDPWIRFDMWASRSWEVAVKATELAISNGPSMSSDDSVDGRVMALFHAAQLAKEFAEMVNPLVAVAGLEQEEETEMMIMTPEMVAEILSDNDDD